MELHEEILELLRQRMRGKHEYINPNFLQEIASAVYDYYEAEDDEVDGWIQNMFGC